MDEILAGTCGIMRKLINKKCFIYPTKWLVSPFQQTAGFEISSIVDNFCASTALIPVWFPMMNPRITTLSTKQFLVGSIRS